ncbi:hypothetical protein Taro_015536 [Colocasia esculenta]|uniref:Uncharacterized protein n=1 Tax=Colocasia esculenta TaxID=4460 RepID=A0A843UTF0_COLES|nr:hypothetical protein [Colocasia esculenta]
MKQSAKKSLSPHYPIGLFAHKVDMKRRKRVKFVERGALRATGCQQNVSSLATERSHASSLSGIKKCAMQGMMILKHPNTSLLRDYSKKLGEVHIPTNLLDGAIVRLPIAWKVPLKIAYTTLITPDLIPVFLNRLGINREADRCDKLQKLSIMNSNARSQFLTCPNTQNYLEEPYETLGTKRSSTFVRDSTENNFPRGWWNRADELCHSTEDVEVQLFPVWNMIKKDLTKNPSYSYFLLDSPYLPARKEIDLDFDPNTEEATSRCKQPVLNDKISMTGLVNQLSSFWGPYEEQPVPSRSNFHLLEFDILPGPNRSKRFSRQHSSLPLLGWYEELNNGEDPFVAPDSAETKGRYQLSLALYHAPQSRGLIRDSEGLDSCTGGTFFHSVGDTIISEDMIDPSVDHVLLPSGTKFAVGSDWEDLSVDYTREFLLPYNPNGQFGHISSNAFGRCLVEPSDTDSRSQITSTVCALYDLSSFGFGISPERTQMVFLPATEE